VTPRLPIIGLDLSLRSTGIATQTGTRTLTSTGHRGDSLRVRHARLRDLATTIALAVTEAAAPRTGLAVIEAPSLGQQRQEGTHDRAGLWWLVVDELLSAGHLVAEVAPASVKKYATGKGNATKDTVMLAVARRYPEHRITDNNQSDAVVLRAMGCHRYGNPLADVPKAHATALDAVAWPDVDMLAVTA
jgi:crossover junction endodeoxyribonuclease RuvC